MALYQVLCGATVMILLSSRGSHAQQPRCGLAPNNKRVIGGQDASPGSWPWQVSLNENGRPMCSGSLITDQWVLTAAHCVPRNYNNMMAFLGRITQSGSNPNEESRGIARAIIHPSYNSLTYDNDIALLRLSAPVKLDDFIYPVCLAAAKSTFYNGTDSWVAGWGTTNSNDQLANFSDVLQELNLPIVGNNECRCAYPQLTENMICAGFRIGGRDACQGDSGAALVTKNESVWVQSGVVSFGEGCAQPKRPGVYARVSRYQTWISDVTNGSQPGFVFFTSSGDDSDWWFNCPSPPPPTTRPYPPPTTRPYPPPTFKTTPKDDDSIFDGGENVVHFSVSSLCVLLLSVFVLG